ncbi:MAG: DUF2303 family protein [Jatrophihabitans sp.]|uniref:DUF2303 family protein n=1 Tax=Jatrophihabitans sp. TaxID=1932789 RepID=UPI003F7DF6E9
MSEYRTDGEVIADLADRAAAREVIELVEDRVIGFVLEHGQHLEKVDFEQYADQPSIKRGTVLVTDAGSLIEYTKRHRHAKGTTLWGDLDKGRVIAVLDDHMIGDASAMGAGWAEHRAVLTLTETPDWKHWAGADGKLMSQASFAEFIEDGATAIIKPAAAEMLEIAQTFHAKTGVDFKSSTRLSSGETQLRYEESTNATAGKAGTIDIPSVFTLGLEPFDGSPRYELVARFRYRIVNGQLALGYKLQRPDLVRKQAFADITAEISTATELPVLAGTPRAAGR